MRSPDTHRLSLPGVLTTLLVSVAIGWTLGHAGRWLGGIEAPAPATPEPQDATPEPQDATPEARRAPSPKDAAPALQQWLADNARLDLVWGCRGDRSRAERVEVEAGEVPFDLPADACVFEVDSLARCPPCEIPTWVHEGEPDADALIEADEQQFEEESRAWAEAGAARRTWLHALRHLFPAGPFLRVVFEAPLPVAAAGGPEVFAYRAPFTAESACEERWLQTGAPTLTPVRLPTGRTPEAGWWLPLDEPLDDALFGLVVAGGADAALVELDAHRERLHPVNLDPQTLGPEPRTLGDYTECGCCGC